MNPEQWVAVCELIKEGDDAFPKERDYARSIFDSVKSRMPCPRESPTVIAGFFIRSFTYAWQRFGSLKGCINVTNEIGTDMFGCYAKGFADYIGHPCMYQDAVSLSADQLDSWSREGGTDADLREALIIVRDVDDVMTEYRLLSGLVHALQKVNRVERGIILLSQYPLDEFIPAQGNSGKSMSYQDLGIEYVLDASALLGIPDD